MRKLFLLIYCIVGSLTMLTAQNKELTISDYGRWNRIVGVGITDSGNWFSYGLRPNGGDDTLFIQQTSTSQPDYTIPFAERPAFSENEKWVAYWIQVPEKEANKLRKSKKPVFQKAELKRLEDGKTWTFDRANAMQFSHNSRYWAVHLKKTAADKSKHKGSDLILMDLQSGMIQNLGNVSDFAFNRKGSHLAYLVDAAEKVGNGIYLMNLKTGRLTVLDNDEAHYSKLIWNDADKARSEWETSGNALAVLKGNRADTCIHTNNTLMVFHGLGSASVVKRMLEPEKADGFPEGMVISDNSNLTFSSDDQMVFLGIQAQEKKQKLDKDTLPNVDVFHWKDERINSVQRRRASRNKRFTYFSSYNIEEDAFLQLADPSMRILLPSKHAIFTVGRDEKPYISDVNWGVSPADLYRVNMATGDRIQFATEVNRTMGLSPDGRYYVYQQEGEIHLYDMENNQTTTISKAAPVSFVNAEHPYPHEHPPYGLAGWSKDGKGVILNHRYDLWYISLDGQTAENLTRGLGDDQEIRFRYVRLDPEEEYMDTEQPLMLSAYGEWTKKSGYFTLAPNKKPKPLLYTDKSIGPLRKARLADQLLFTQQTFVDFPDYYTSNTQFVDPVRLTHANPQQAEYAWGRRVLIDYTNSKGERLQGTLALPPNYKAGEKYPMVVYFYEKMSQRHHQYAMPVYDDRPHASTYTSNGYLFFMPDNTYETGRPGTSALDCITSAVQEVIDLGYADPEKIGLQGHSWGGYQSSFIVTQTDMFACVVTGAPPTDLESFYNNIYGNTGTNHTGIMEIGQVRMGRNVTPWNSRAVYQRENPMFHVPKIKTPFMILHGTNDGAVDWTQGLEFYNAARRLGKEVIFLSYPDEGHHLRRESNQKDFQIRMKQYFDHYLMGQDAPGWMVEGIPHLEKVYEKANQ